MKYPLILGLTICTTFALNIPCRGCIELAEGPEFYKSTERLNLILKALYLSDDGPWYRLNEALSVAVEDSYGHLDRIIADLEDENGAIKTCDVRIYTNDWWNHYNVRIECTGLEDIYRIVSY